jgi:hypothetical protein
MLSNNNPNKYKPKISAMQLILNAKHMKARQDEITSANRWWWSIMRSLASGMAHI